MLETSYSAALIKWLKKFQRFKVGYKNGAFRLNCLVNSPYTIVESLAKMPFSSHNRERQYLYINTLFAESSVWYDNVEEGMWLMCYENHYKKNLMIKNIFVDDIPSEYNYIHFLKTKDRLHSKPMLADGLTLTDNTWSIAKIGNPLESFHYQGSTELSVLVFFTEEWLEKNNLRYNSVQYFFESKGKHLVMDADCQTTTDYYEQFLSLLKERTGKQTNALKTIKRFIHDFLLNLDALALSKEHFCLPDSDWKRILLAERYLHDSIFKGFPGIENIAENVRISPTKLKHDFKLVHQKTMYAYFQEKQMSIAHQLLSKQNYKVKEVANLLGYENASKFSEVFKKHTGVLPSAMFDKVEPQLNE